MREQRGLGLDRHVLLAAEGAAVGHQLDEDIGSGADAEEARHLAPVVEDALPLRAQVQPAVGKWLGKRTLGLEEEVLDALRASRCR